jgi:hypothetical protein
LGRTGAECQIDDHWSHEGVATDLLIKSQQTKSLNISTTEGLGIAASSVAHHLPTDTCQIPPDLAAVVAAWPTLPEPIRAGILAMVKAASAGGR